MSVTIYIKNCATAASQFGSHGMNIFEEGCSHEMNPELIPYICTETVQFLCSADYNNSSHRNLTDNYNGYVKFRNIKFCYSLNS